MLILVGYLIAFRGGMFFGFHDWFQAVPVQDDLCKWLAEAVQKKPSEWKANEVKEFETYILGNEDMKRKLIVRDCYVKMQVEAMKWL